VAMSTGSGGLGGAVGAFFVPNAAAQGLSADHTGTAARVSAFSGIFGRIRDFIFPRENPRGTFSTIEEAGIAAGLAVMQAERAAAAGSIDNIRAPGTRFATVIRRTSGGFTYDGVRQGRRLPLVGPGSEDIVGFVVGRGFSLSLSGLPQAEQVPSQELVSLARELNLTGFLSLTQEGAIRQFTGGGDCATVFGAAVENCQ